MPYLLPDRSPAIVFAAVIKISAYYRHEKKNHAFLAWFKVKICNAAETSYCRFLSRSLISISSFSSVVGAGS